MSFVSLMKRFLSLSTMAAGMLAGTQCAACVKSWKFFAIKSDHSCDANTYCCVLYDKVQPHHVGRTCGPTFPFYFGAQKWNPEITIFLAHWSQTGPN